MSKPPSKRHLSTNKRLEDDSSNKKTKRIRDALLGNKEQVHCSLHLQHKGKRLLLRASTIYGTMARVLEGEENFIFLYIMFEINPDCQTASLLFVRFLSTSCQQDTRLFHNLLVSLLLVLIGCIAVSLLL
jgi:hypothetical protein